MKYAGKWNKSVKADTSKLEAVAAAANAEVANEKKQAKATDWIWLIGLALIVSALSQKIGLVMNNGLNEIGLDMIDKGTAQRVRHCSRSGLRNDPARQASCC